MARDLSPLFPAAAESSARKFRDKEIMNRDARVLEGGGGKAALAYAFVNREYLVIAGGEDSLKEVFRRFAVYRYFGR